MSDVSLSSVLSFLDADEVATVLQRVRAEQGRRTKRSERDERTFLFVGDAGEDRPSSVVWVDAEAAFDERTVRVFDERCASQGVAGTLLTTGDPERASETLALAFAAADQRTTPDDGEPRLLVDPEDVSVPVALETGADLVAAVESAGLAAAVVDEYHEPHQPEFEAVLDEIDAAEAADEAADGESGTGVGLAAVLVALAALAVVAVLFGPL